MLGQLLPSYQGFAIDIVSVYINLAPFSYYLFMGRRTLLARATVPFPSLFNFFGAAFPLGGASIISEYPDAFGVFECPHLCWARKKYLILILVNYL